MTIKSSVSHAMEYDGCEDSVNPIKEFQPLNNEDVVTLLNKSNGKFCDLDAILTSLMKDCSNEFLPVIKHIINTSLAQGYFPLKYQAAVVKPLLKKPKLDNILKNYRPVSNMNFIGKLIEQAVSVELNHHAVSNEIGEPLQSAYKPGPT